MSATYEIQGFRVLKVGCEIRFKPGTEGIQIQLEDRITCKKPADPTAKKRLLEIETTITSDDAPDFKIDLISQVVFIFSETPENFEEVLRTECYPVAKDKVYEAIKGITAAMGISPIDLKRLQE